MMIAEPLSRNLVNPFMCELQPHSNGPLYSNTVIGTLAVDGWAGATFHLVQRGGAWMGCVHLPNVKVRGFI